MGVRPLLQVGNALRVVIDAGHVVTEIGKAGARNEPDIAGAHHRDLRDGSLMLSHRHRRNAAPQDDTATSPITSDIA